jgi:hypothetical protein
MIMDGDHYIFLFLSRIAQQHLHPVSQGAVILDTYVECCHQAANDHRPLKEPKEDEDRDRIMEDEGEKQEVADGNKQDQSENEKPLMPDTPRLDVSMQRSAYSQTINGKAAQCDKSEECCSQTFIPLIHAETKWL